MARVKTSTARKHHRESSRQAEGYYGNRSRTFKSANEAVPALAAVRVQGPPGPKGDFRRLWIQRINAAARENGTSYSRFVSGLKGARGRGRPKVLADLAVWTPRHSALLVTDGAGGRRRARTPTKGAATLPSAAERVLTVRLGLRHQRVQRLRRLLQRRRPALGDGAFVAEGTKLLDCALDADVSVEAVYVGAGALGTSGVRESVEARDERGARVLRARAGSAREDRRHRDAPTGARSRENS